MASFKLTDVTMDNMPRTKEDLLEPEDDEWLNDPKALELQRGQMTDAVAAAWDQEQPAHVSDETHKLVCATMAGGAALGERRRQRDAEVELLRQRRLTELKKIATLVPMAGDARGMLEAVAKADERTPVLVHVFARIAACQRVDRALSLLAARQAQRPNDCRFVGVHAPQIVRLDADAFASFPDFGLQIDEERLPALLVYRARELVHAEFSVDLDGADDVEDLLDGCL